jgi:hypothetical protein
MEWATQKSGWEQPAEKGSGPADVMGPHAGPESELGVSDKPGTAHVDSAATCEKNFNW